MLTEHRKLIGKCQKYITDLCWLIISAVDAPPENHFFIFDQGLDSENACTNPIISSNALTNSLTHSLTTGLTKSFDIQKKKKTSCNSDIFQLWKKPTKMSALK